MGRFKVRGVHVVYTTQVLTGGQDPAPEMEEYLKERLMTIMLCTNCVCVGTFDIREWVSESTITEKEEVMDQVLDYEICIPCVVQWCMIWFSQHQG